MADVTPAADDAANRLRTAQLLSSGHIIPLLHIALKSLPLAQPVSILGKLGQLSGIGGLYSFLLLQLFLNGQGCCLLPQLALQSWPFVS